MQDLTNTKLIVNTLLNLHASINSDSIDVLMSFVENYNLHNNKPEVGEVISNDIISMQLDVFRLSAVNLSTNNCKVVLGYLYNGEKLNGVKLLKDYTSIGLKDAKELCDKYYKKQN